MTSCPAGHTEKRHDSDSLGVHMVMHQPVGTCVVALTKSQHCKLGMEHGHASTIPLTHELSPVHTHIHCGTCMPAKVEGTMIACHLYYICVMYILLEVYIYIYVYICKLLTSLGGSMLNVLFFCFFSVFFSILIFHFQICFFFHNCFEIILKSGCLPLPVVYVVCPIFL